MDWITAAALATLIVGLFAWLRADLTALRKELAAQGNELRAAIARQDKELRAIIIEQVDNLRGDISLLGKEVGKLRERMAHMEGLLDGLREAVSGIRAA